MLPDSAQDSDIRYLNFPEVERHVFPNNFLDLVVIELRFPTLLRLKKAEPLEIQEAIFGEFPIYQSSQTMQMTPLGTTEPEPSYEFTSRKRNYKVQLSASNLVLETRDYTSFEDFLAKVEYLIGACIPLIKTDFFTRIGLRYINKIGGLPNVRNETLKWVHPSLLGPVATNEIGTVGSMKGEIAGKIESGANYNFKYGLAPLDSGSDRTFILDYDYSRQDVEVDEVVGYLNEFHNLHLPFFWWALGKEAKGALENGSAKKG